MSTELEKILGGEGETPSSGESKKEEPKVEPKDEEILKKEEQLSNINKAIAEANEQLRKTRKQVKQPTPEEEELPKIDMNDPSAKAWDKHIKDNVNPLQAENEKEKDEVRSYALKQFLSDKPALAGDSNKLKALLETYKNLSEGKISEKTTEGVLLYLDKAYAAENYEELTRQSRERRISQAKADAIYSDPAVSRGSTSYSEQRETTPNLSEEERAILAKWGMSPAEWITLKKKYPKD